MVPESSFQEGAQRTIQGNGAVTGDEAFEHRGTKCQVSHLRYGNPGHSLCQDVGHMGFPPAVCGVHYYPEAQIRRDSQGIPYGMCEGNVRELGPGRFERQADAGRFCNDGNRGDGLGEPLDRHLVRPSACCPSRGLHGGGAEPLRHFDSQYQGIAGA